MTEFLLIGILRVRVSSMSRLDSLHAGSFLPRCLVHSSLSKSATGFGMSLWESAGESHPLTQHLHHSTDPTLRCAIVGNDRTLYAQRKIECGEQLVSTPTSSCSCRPIAGADEDVI